MAPFNRKHRFMAVIVCSFAVMLFCTASLSARPQLISILKEGDLIFQETRSRQARALQLATKSRYTHVGMAIKHQGRWQVLEAVQPVRITPLQAYINRGVNRHIVVKRLRNYEQLMTALKILELKRQGYTYLGKNYDIYFGWDDSRIYCTELVWKIYNSVLNVEVGKLQRLRDFDLSHPFVKKIMHQRYGNKPPLDEPVIAVSTMFKAENLLTVYQSQRLKK